MIFYKKLLSVLFILTFITVFFSCDDSRDIRYGAKTYRSGDHSGRIESLKATPDGGYIAVGEATNSIAKDKFGNPTELEVDVWVMKVDLNGVIQWEKAYASNGWQYGKTVALSNDGGYFVFSSGDILGHYWCLKLDNKGNIEWQKAYNNSAMPFGKVDDMQRTSDGGYVLLGNCGIVKINAAGTIQWARKYFDDADPNYSLMLSIRQIKTGGYIIAGSIPSSAEANIENIGSLDAFVMELNAEGSIVWTKQYGMQNYFTEFNCIEIRSDGYLLSGRIGQTMKDDSWIVKINSTGSIIWQRKYDSGEDVDAFNWIENTPDNGFIVSGETGNWNKKNIIAMKFDSNGNMKWQKGYNFNMFSDTRQEIHVDPNGFVMGTAITMSDGSLNGIVLKVNENGDAPDASFMKEANLSMTATNVQVKNCTVSTANALFTVTSTKATPYATKTKVKEY